MGTFSVLNVFFFVLVLYQFSSSQMVNSQMVSMAHVGQRLITATAGFPTNFSCESFGQPISLCIWEKFNVDKSKPSTLISFTQGGNKTTSLPGYYLHGDLEKGICGLQVENVTRRDMSQWQCTLFTNSNVYRAAVDINVQKKPQPPKFFPDELGNLVDGQTIGSNGNALTCFSAQGLPPPSFKWFLGDEPYQGELFPVNTTEDEEGNTYTFQQLKNQDFTWKENGKSLKCAIVHHMITAEDIQEVSVYITVKYKPRADQNSVSIYVPEIGHPITLLPFHFYANPKPRIWWEVDGVRISAGFTSPDRRTEALVLEEAGPSHWLAQIRIKDMTAKDLRKKYVLKTENDVGRQDFSVCITQSPAKSGVSCLSEGLFLKVHQRPHGPPPPPPPRDEQDEDSRSGLGNPLTPIFEKLKDVQQQMQLLIEQEARLQTQLQRIKGPKSVEDDEVEGTTVVTKLISSEEKVTVGDKPRDGRLLRFNSQANKASQTPSRIIPIYDGLAEVKVESPGLHIRRKST